MLSASTSAQGGRVNLALIAGAATLLVLAAASLFIGVGEVSLAGLLHGENAAQLQLLLVSRLPRTIALILSGMSMAVAAVIMQLLFRNRFVEPTTTGTVEAASMGLLAAALIAPGFPLLGKMAVATAFALAANYVFLRIVNRIELRSVVIVPLVGLMFGGIIQSLTTFFAYRFDMLQSLYAWTNGDFSGILRGRYELLWLSAALAILAYIVADRFTVAGLGRNFTTSLGLDYHRTMGLGFLIISLTTAVTVVTAGTVPFLGLTVANLVSMFAGDNLRRSLPWVAGAGAAFLLACDIIGRTVRYPYEIPVGTVVGVVGSACFILILLRRSRQIG